MSNRVVLAESVELEDGNFPERLETEKFSFLKFRSKIVTITPVMREILEAVKAPRAVEEVLQEVCEHNQCSVESIRGAVISFLNKMMKMGVLTFEGKKGKSTALLDRWEETKTFREFTLLELIKKKNAAYLFKCCKADEPEVFYTLKIVLNKKSSTDFFHEITILNSIPFHENIRRCFYSSSADEEFPYLLLEYIDGKSLSDPTIKNETRMHNKYKIGKEVLMSIDHLHSNNYLHGDIHASNFLIDGDYGVHLIDLGMSHQAGEEDAVHGGIAQYMAPERLPNHNLNFSRGPGDYRSEVFQLGICLYLLLAGTHPFNAFLLRELAEEIQHQPPPPLTQTRLGEPIPERVANVVYKALEKNPEKRYQAVSEMLSAWNCAINIKHSEHVKHA